MEEKKTDLRIYYASAVTAVLIWSTSFISTKVAYATIPPITLGALRFVIATVVLALILLVKREFVRPSTKDIGTLALSGLLGITMYFTLQNLGVNFTTASNAALIVASYPAITSFLELLFYRVSISKLKVLGLFMAMVGIYFLSYSGNEGEASNELLGNLIMLTTGFVWAFYNFVTRGAVNRIPAVTVSFYQTFFGTLFFIPLAFFERSQWQVPDTISLLNLAFLGVFCSVIAFLLYNYGLRRLTPGNAVSLANLVPIFGAFFSVVILHETLTLRQLGGGAIVLLGVYLSSRQTAAAADRETQVKNQLTSKK